MLPPYARKHTESGVLERMPANTHHVYGFTAARTTEQTNFTALSERQDQVDAHCWFLKYFPRVAQRFSHSSSVIDVRFTPSITCMAQSRLFPTGMKVSEVLCLARWHVHDTAEKLLQAELPAPDAHFILLKSMATRYGRNALRH